MTKIFVCFHKEHKFYIQIYPQNIDCYMPYEQMSEQKLQFVTFILNTLSKTFNLTYIPAKKSVGANIVRPLFICPYFRIFVPLASSPKNRHNKKHGDNTHRVFYYPQLRHLNLGPLRIVITTAVHTVLDIIKCLQHFLGRLLCAKAHNNDKYKTYRKTYDQ